jgi:hypothetical protein
VGYPLGVQSIRLLTSAFWRVTVEREGEFGMTDAKEVTEDDPE